MLELIMLPQPENRTDTCLQGSGVGAWLQALSIFRKFVLQSQEFKLASNLLHEIGASYAVCWLMEKCDCGKQLDPDGYITSLLVRLVVVRSGHTFSIVGVWSECLSHLHIMYKKEPKHRYSDSDDRPDIFAVDPETSNDIELDVSMAHPWVLDVVNKAAVEDGTAALPQEELKKSQATELHSILFLLLGTLWPLGFRGTEAVEPALTD